MKASPEAQRRLLDLQAVDTALVRLAHRRRTLPELAELEVAAAEIAGLEDERDSALVAVDELDRDISRVERHIHQAHVARDRGELLRHGLATLNRRRAEMTKRRATMATALDEIQCRLAKAGETRGAAEHRRDQALAEIERDETFTRASRGPLSEHLPGDLLSLYDTIRHDTGLGAALFESGRCGGCRMELYGADLVRVKAAEPDDVVRCEECGRIIVRTNASTTVKGQPSWAPPPMEDATRFILVRHGETSRTREGRYSGRGDVPLTDVGEVQALAAAGRVAGISPNVTAVMTSPLGRCVRTAELIAAEVGGVPVTVLDDLIECDFGEWEGRTFAEVQERWPREMNAWLESVDVAPPGGESFRAVSERVRRAVATVLEAYGGGVVVMVSHVTPIKLALQDALAASDAFLHRLFLDAAGISTMDIWPDGNVAVRSVNETAHVR